MVTFPLCVVLWISDLELSHRSFIISPLIYPIFTKTNDLGSWWLLESKALLAAPKTAIPARCKHHNWSGPVIQPYSETVSRIRLFLIGKRPSKSC